MASYLILFNYTTQGIQRIRESPARVEAAKQTVRSLGGEVKTFYGILGGENDTMFVVEAPDDEAIARMVLSIGAMGNVRSRTYRLFTEGEFSKVIHSLP